MTAVIEIRELIGDEAGRDDVARLLGLSSPAGLGARFTLGGSPEPADVFRRYQRFLLAGPPDGVALMAVEGGLPVGLLNLVADEPRRAELGVLVADPWQRRGIATAMAGWLWGSGRWAGWTVHASVREGNFPAVGLLRRQGFLPVPSFERGELEFELAVPGTMTAVMKEAGDGEDAARADGVQRRAAGADAGSRRDRHAGRRRARAGAAGFSAALLPGR